MFWQAKERLKFPTHRWNLALRMCWQSENANFLLTETVLLYSKERLSRMELPAPGQESTVGMEFCRESPDPGWGIDWKNRIPPEITRFWTWKFREEWNSARNYWLMDEESTGRMEFCQELLAHGRGIHQKNGIPPGLSAQLAHGHGFRPARLKIFWSETIPGILILKGLYLKRLIF
jgi:hypothetical protein